MKAKAPTATHEASETATRRSYFLVKAAAVIVVVWTVANLVISDENRVQAAENCQELEAAMDYEIEAAHSRPEGILSVEVGRLIKSRHEELSCSFSTRYMYILGGRL